MSQSNGLGLTCHRVEQRVVCRVSLSQCYGLGLTCQRVEQRVICRVSVSQSNGLGLTCHHVEQRKVCRVSVSQSNGSGLTFHRVEWRLFCRVSVLQSNVLGLICIVQSRGQSVEICVIVQWAGPKMLSCRVEGSLKRLSVIIKAWPYLHRVEQRIACIDTVS